MKFDTKVTSCTNCHQPLSDGRVYGFQGIRICSNCSKMVQRALDKMQQQLQFMANMYHEVLRVALIKGELRFQELPEATAQKKVEGVTKEEVMEQMKKMIKGEKDDHGAFRSKVAGRSEGHAR